MTKEMKLNNRLNEVVNEYLECENKKLEFAKEKVESDMLDRTAVETLHLMQCHIDTCTQKIIKMVSRMNRQDLEVQNEVAILVYNYYEPLMRRGLFSFN